VCFWYSVACVSQVISQTMQEPERVLINNFTQVKPVTLGEGT